MLTHSSGQYYKYRVRTGHGKLEKVGEFEWSGKGQGKIFFLENEKLMSDFQAKMHQLNTAHQGFKIER